MLKRIDSIGFEAFSLTAVLGLERRDALQIRNVRFLRIADILMTASVKLGSPRTFAAKCLRLAI